MAGPIQPIEYWFIPNVNCKYIIFIKNNMHADISKIPKLNFCHSMANGSKNCNHHILTRKKIIGHDGICQGNR